MSQTKALIEKPTRPIRLAHVWLYILHYINKFLVPLSCPKEHSSVGRDMHCYIQGPGFEPRTPHLFTFF